MSEAKTSLLGGTPVKEILIEISENPDYICESDFLLHFISSVSPLLVCGMCRPYCYCCVSWLNLVASTSYSLEIDCPRYFCSPCPSVPVCLTCTILSLSAWCFLYGGHVKAYLVMMFFPFFFLRLWISHLWLPSLILLPLIFFFGHLLTAVGCSGHSTNCWRPTLPLCGYQTMLNFLEYIFKKMLRFAKVDKMKLGFENAHE